MLLMARYIPHEHLVAGLATALRAGALTADAVAPEARKAAQTEDEPPLPASSALAVGVQANMHHLVRMKVHRF